MAPLRAIGPMSDTLGEPAYAEGRSIYSDPVAPGAVESGAVDNAGV